MREMITDMARIMVEYKWGQNDRSGIYFSREE